MFSLEARLVLISKDKGPADEPLCYRPLCMLDTVGKLLERLLRPRLQEDVAVAGDLAERQYGFRRRRLIVDTILQMVEAARATERGNHFSRPVCLLVTLDVKNTFNSVRWTDALSALEREFRVSEYLRCMIGNYLKDHFLVYETRDELRRRGITSDAAQGSVLDPELWFTTYDGIVRMEMPESTLLIGYADDVAAVITARYVEVAQMRLNQVIQRVCEWMEDHGLALAVAKTEIVLLTKKRILLVMEIHVGDVMVTIGNLVRYLGVTLDSRLTFGGHIRKVADKAARVMTAFSRIMANTAESVMLYVAEVWADAMNTDMHRR